MKVDSIKSQIDEIIKKYGIYFNEMYTENAEYKDTVVYLKRGDIRIEVEYPYGVYLGRIALSRQSIFNTQEYILQLETDIENYEEFCEKFDIIVLSILRSAEIIKGEYISYLPVNTDEFSKELAAILNSISSQYNRLADVPVWSEREFELRVEQRSMLKEVFEKAMSAAKESVEMENIER